MSDYSILICNGGQCRLNLSKDLERACKNVLDDENEPIDVDTTNCMRMCDTAPNMKVVDQSTHKTVELCQQVSHNEAEAVTKKYQQLSKEEEKHL